MKRLLLISCILIEKFPEFIQKIQNTVLFIKSDIVTSKYSPSTATHLCQRLIQLSKHFWNSIVGIAIRTVFDFSITSFQLLKRVPRNGFLIRTEKNRREPYQVNSMAVGFVLFLVKNSLVANLTPFLKL